MDEDFEYDGYDDQWVDNLEYSHPYDQDNEICEPVSIDLPLIDESADTIYAISEFMCRASRTEGRMNEIASSRLDEIYDEIDNDDNSSTTIIGYVQRRHGWDMEILAERRDVERILFEEHNMFDDDMWFKVLNSQELRDLHREVFKASEEYIRAAIAGILRRDYKAS